MSLQSLSSLNIDVSGYSVLQKVKFIRTQPDGPTHELLSLPIDDILSEPAEGAGSHSMMRLKNTPPYLENDNF